ncbi:fatty acid oxidation complex subunit alpha FadB [Methylocella sp.]|uniref:fatty acid oxidation complex subunit alpha FadB n=1 Tax=Methylocella sp. TaxID=1978226 RepID=UPI0035B3FCE9
MIFQGESIEVREVGEGFHELRFDRKGEAVNKLDRLAFRELEAALAALAAAPGLRGVLVSSAKETFVVGADIFEFTEVFEAGREAVERFVAANAKIVSALAALPAPSVAAVGGLALGGGFELALAADYRVVSDTAKVGLPEVTLGIFPGYGGTARLPRLIGLAEAARWIVSGAQQGALTTLEDGAADAVCPPEELFDVALGLLKAAAADPAGWAERRREGAASLGLPREKVDELLSGAQIEAARALPHYPAAHEAVEVLREGAELSLEEALALEAKRFAEVAASQAATSLVGNFVNDQAVRKIAKSHAKGAAKVRRVGVLGAGVMGAGVAYQSALKGVPAVLKDVSRKALDNGVAHARNLLDKQVERGRMKPEEADAAAAAIHATESFADLAGVDVVVEAIVEDLKIKLAVFGDVEEAVGEKALIVSNTSSLRVKDLSAGVSRPRNFLGMHFFNPVPAMALVEVIRGPQTSDAALATIVDYALTLGKTPIVVGDCPGFVVNRVLTPYLIAFLKLVSEGVDFRDVDRAMEGFGWPMGPAWLSDVIGLDICQHVVEIVSEGFSARMEHPKPGAYELLMADGRLGQKNGRGFYVYGRDDTGRPARTAEPAVFELLKAGRTGAVRLTDAEIRERMMIPMLFEAARCLEDGTGSTPGEIDMCLILGLGLPRYLGGALRYADWLGLGTVANRAKAYEELGPIYRPGEAFVAKAEKGEKFYA